MLGKRGEAVDDSTHTVSYSEVLWPLNYWLNLFNTLKCVHEDKPLT